MSPHQLLPRGERPHIEQLYVCTNRAIEGITMVVGECGSVGHYGAMPKDTDYEHGRGRRDPGIGYLPKFWLSPFPRAETSEDKASRGRPREDRLSPIYDYSDGGIGLVQ